MSRYADITSLVFLYCFLFLLFPSSVFSRLSPNQTSIMTTLYSILNNNGTASPWYSTRQQDPCSWNGVTCGNDNSSVIRLSLPGFGLSASDFLSAVCKIETLQSLDLSHNYFPSIPEGFMSGCGGIDGLKVLNFSRNALQGPLPAFSPGFSGLESLDLSFNVLTGNISNQLDGLVALKSLNLSFNNINGSFPTLKSMLLEELELSQNHLQGIIPPNIANYVELRIIDLTGNKLSGSIPDSIGNLPKLKVLILSENNLSGELPQTISNITTLYRFAANQNQFGGQLPRGLTSWLRFLDLSYNKLTGPVPADFFSQANLQSVDLSYNSLDGSIPENISASLIRLRLGSNRFNGSIPSSFSELQRLTYLELDNNSLSDAIPVALGSCRNLALLNLAQNNLTGPLPDALSDLGNLQVLKLQSNKLDGEIPDQITQLSKLSTLNISWNSLTGAIPSSISDLKNLVQLNLQGNNLSGSIPDTINSMNSLLELQLGQNQLGGKIPEMPVKLQIALNLSSNNFNRTIPKTLSRLMDLEVLDLSNNQFSGEIPFFLTQLNSLTQLILSNNQLSGIIPEFSPFVSLVVNGNLDLRNGTQPKTSAQSTKKKSVTVAVILPVATAALVVGVVMAAVWLCSKRLLKVNDQQSQPGEDLNVPQVIGGNLLTTNVIHRTNIDFITAMEAVADPTSIVLKTRFSTFYKATMPSGTTYYVKKLNWSDKLFQCGSHDRFGQELEVIGRLSNSNVMTPLAYVLTTDSAYLFYAYAQKGTLFDVLHGKSGDTLDWPSRYSIAVGVAQGLAFLHGCNSGPVLLLDLSSKNIFLKSLKEPLVGDIELCKVIDPSKSTGSLSTVAGSVGYIPPEYAYTMRITMAGNVYSFGVVLLELLTGKPAVSQGTELAKWVLSSSMQQDKWDQILDFNISRTSLATRNQMLAVLKVALSCVSISPEGRPKMKSVLRMILSAQ